MVWDVVSQPEAIRFGAVISSGPRDAVSDPGLYFGASSVYTCFTAVADVPMARYSGSLSYEDLPCPTELVDTLEPGAMLASIYEFSG